MTWRFWIPSHGLIHDRWIGTTTRSLSPTFVLWLKQGMWAVGHTCDNIQIDALVTFSFSKFSLDTWTDQLIFGHVPRSFRFSNLTWSHASSEEEGPRSLRLSAYRWTGFRSWLQLGIWSLPDEARSEEPTHIARFTASSAFPRITQVSWTSVAI